MLKNLTSSHSPGSNCEDDLSEGALTAYHVLFANIIEIDKDTHNSNQEHRVNDGLVKLNIYIKCLNYLI